MDPHAKAITMNISQLLNPDAGPLSRDSFEDSVKASISAPNRSHGSRSVRGRSEFIGLVTENVTAKELMTLGSEGMSDSDPITLDGLRSAVNEPRKHSYTISTTYPPQENLISSITTPALSDASASSLTSPTSSGTGDLAFQLPIGSISFHSRDSSCGDRNMVTARAGLSRLFHITY